jgi:hypothetical protein
MHPFLSFNATYTGIMVSYGFYHKHQGWAFFVPVHSICSILNPYSRETSLLAASIDLSVSQFARVDKSLKFSGLSLSTLKTVRLPIPNKDYVESHLVMACAWFYMLSMQTKRSVKVESKVGSLLNRLIKISWFYASITFLQCNIHRNYGFIRVLSNACLLAATARNLFQS